MLFAIYLQGPQSHYINYSLPPGGSNSKVSGLPTVRVPAYSLLKQEQLQLAQLAFVIKRKFASSDKYCYPSNSQKVMDWDFWGPNIWSEEPGMIHQPVLTGKNGDPRSGAFSYSNSSIRRTFLRIPGRNTSGSCSDLGTEMIVWPVRQSRIITHVQVFNWWYKLIGFVFSTCPSSTGDFYYFYSLQIPQVDVPSVLSIKHMTEVQILHRSFHVSGRVCILRLLPCTQRFQCRNCAQPYQSNE